MKKFFSGIIVTILFVIMLFFSLNFAKRIIPPSLPNIKVVYKQQNIETVLGEYNWFDKKTGGNTCFGDSPEKLVKNLKIISVKKEDTIKFTFKTIYKQPIKTTINLVVPNKKSPSKFSVIKQSSNNNYFNVPKKTGEYIFLITGYWDETHSAEYYFRVNLQ